MASKHKTYSSSSPSRDHPDTHIDRNSAIALSIMLFLILGAIAWYLRLHFAQKRQADLERQLQVEQGQSESAMESVTWNRQCSSYSSQETSLAQASSPSKPKATVIRKSSTTPSSSSDISGQRQESEKKKSPVHLNGIVPKIHETLY
jgi:cytoskeletal protein RodZ